MPRTALQQALHLRDDQRHDEIRNQKRNRTALLARRRLFQSGKQRQQNKNRARKQDLQLEVDAVGLSGKDLIGAHARRHTSCAIPDAISVVQLARQDAAVGEAPCTSLQRGCPLTIKLWGKRRWQSADARLLSSEPRSFAQPNLLGARSRHRHLISSLGT